MSEVDAACSVDGREHWTQWDQLGGCLIGAAETGQNPRRLRAGYGEVASADLALALDVEKEESKKTLTCPAWLTGCVPK